MKRYRAFGNENDLDINVILARELLGRQIKSIAPLLISAVCRLLWDLNSTTIAFNKKKINWISRSSDLE